MIQLFITKTGRGYNPKDVFSVFDHQIENFKTIMDAYGLIKETYGKAKRSKMFVDADGGCKHIGYVIGFRNADLSRSTVNKWIQQDWVEFREVKTINLEAANA
mgnify:CR=1 FL=1